jgi:hypothetical protein
MPPRFREEVERDRAAIISEVVEVEQTLREYTRELQKIDPHLRMIKAKPNADPEGPLKAGYYHVIRDAPGMPVYVTPLMWDNGEYREPGSWVYEHVQYEDLWNDRSQKAQRKRNKEFEKARQRQKDRDALARAAEYDERVKQANSTQILVKGGIPR